MLTQTDILLWYETFTYAKMAIPLWYAILSGCVLAMWLLFHFILWLVTFTWMHTSFFFLKRFVYPHLFGRLPFIGATTRSEILIGILYITVNVLCITVGMTSMADVSARAATMSAINLIPLLCGPRLILMTQLLGISLRAHLGLHWWFGSTAVAQALLHIVLSVIRNMPFQWTTVNLSGVVVCPEFIMLTFKTDYRA